MKLKILKTSLLSLFFGLILFTNVNASTYNQQLTNSFTTKDSPDWITKERYDYSLLYRVHHKKGQGNYIYLDLYSLTNYTNPLYFEVKYTPAGGKRPSATNPPKNFDMRLNKVRYGYYRSNKEIKVTQRGCVTLYEKRTKYTPLKIVGTSCFRAFSISTLNKGYNSISAPGNLLTLKFKYTGNQDTAVLMATPIFLGTVPNDWGNYKVTRANYVTSDWQTSSLSNFKDITYKIKWVRGYGQDKELLKVVCGEKQDPRFRTRLIRSPSHSLPSSGIFYNYSKKDPKNCSFEMKTNYLLYGFFTHAPMIRRLGVKPVNNAPVITTTSLKEAVLNAPYKETIKGMDKDGDKFTISVSGLPKGLYVASSSYYGRKPRHGVITIKGTPQNVKPNSLYTIRVVAKDSKGAKTTKFLKLKISGKFIGVPKPIVSKPIKLPGKKPNPVIKPYKKPVLFNKPTTTTYKQNPINWGIDG